MRTWWRHLRRSGRLLDCADRIECPVIHGTYDPHPAEGVQKPLAGVLKSFKFVRLEQCGHSPWKERHAHVQFYAVLREELNGRNVPESCPFCTRDPRVVGRVTLENEHCLFLEGVEPVLSGSGIIVTRAHRRTVFDLTADEWMATYDLLQRVQAKMTQELQPDGFNVGWNCGEVGGQAIAHAHLHVIPRFADEPFAGKGIRHWLKSEANIRPSKRETR